MRPAPGKSVGGFAVRPGRLQLEQLEGHSDEKMNMFFWSDSAKNNKKYFQYTPSQNYL